MGDPIVGGGGGSPGGSIKIHSTGDFPWRGGGRGLTAKEAASLNKKDQKIVTK